MQARENSKQGLYPMESAVSSRGSRLNHHGLQNRLPPHLIGSQVYERNSSIIKGEANSRLSDNRSMSLNSKHKA